MKVALLGYGKMGKTIEALLATRNHTVCIKIDSHNQDNISAIKKSDVAIEFTQPEAVGKNLKTCFDLGIPVVCGTTGWLSNKDEIDTYCKEKNGTYFFASNFSLGVNLFFRLNESLAKMMNSRPDYDVEIDETHHKQKKDSPSGTAITLAGGITTYLDRKNNWSHSKNLHPEHVVINSFREDSVPGTHNVTYSSPIDEITIRHTAHSREGFALGAVMVAEWIKNKKGILTMSDFMKL